MTDTNVVNDIDFDAVVLKSPQPVLVGFTAPWCGACKMLYPTLQAVAEEYADQVRLVQLDVDVSSATANLFNIKSMPTVILFDGGLEKQRTVGIATRSHFAAQIEAALV